MRKPPGRAVVGADMEEPPCRVAWGLGGQLYERLVLKSYSRHMLWIYLGICLALFSAMMKIIEDASDFKNSPKAKALAANVSAIIATASVLVTAFAALNETPMTEAATRWTWAILCVAVIGGLMFFRWYALKNPAPTEQEKSPNQDSRQ